MRDAVTEVAAIDRGPLSLSERALGPDLARGLMLLCIALANSHYFLDAPSVLGGYPQNGSALDRGVTWVLHTFVDGRAWPMFGLLFGYGVAQIVRRHTDLGRKPVRRLLRRRSLILVALGLLHGVLLYVGDIIGAYGVLLFLGLWAVRWRDGWLLVVAAGFLVLNAWPDPSWPTLSADRPDRSMLPPDVLSGVLERAMVTPFIALLGWIGFAAPFLVGLWAGRRRLLERPREHRRLLGTIAVVGITAAVAGAQPAALVVAGVSPVPTGDTLAWIGALHDVTGMIGGAGYAAAIALLATRLDSGPGRFTRAVVATGQRSMTCYLAQSPVWAVLFTPYLLDLSTTLTVASTAAVAVITWLATVALGAWLSRWGSRGPFETLVRRWTYRTVARSRPLGVPGPGASG